MKKIAIILLSIVLLISVGASTIVATERQTIIHDNCTGGELMIVHSKHIAAYQSGQHQLEDGSMCVITTIRMEHAAKCSKCQKVLYKFTENCQTSHSLCGESTSCPY